MTRARLALPSLPAALAASALWAFANGIAALLGLWLREWLAGYLPVVAIFAAGAFLALMPAIVATALVAGGRSAERRFAASFVSLAVLTVALTAALFALEYRTYYAQWHAEFPSVVWGIQLFFTSAAAAYQFAVLGLRLYFPIGFVALFLASAWIARLTR